MLYLSRSQALSLWCWLLVSLHLLTGWCLAHGYSWGSASHEALWFLGLNGVTMAFSSSRPQVGKLNSPLLVIGMVLIALNFFRAAGLADWRSLAGSLHMLSAQALWLAFPSYWASRQEP
jgi:hypothetical protein